MTCIVYRPFLENEGPPLWMFWRIPWMFFLCTTVIAATQALGGLVWLIIWSWKSVNNIWPAILWDFLSLNLAFGLCFYSLLLPACPDWQGYTAYISSGGSFWTHLRRNIKKIILELKVVLVFTNRIIFTCYCRIICNSIVRKERVH